MFRSHKINVDIPGSFFERVSEFRYLDLADRVFPAVIDQVQKTLEQSKYVKRAKGKVLQYDDGGYAINFTVRTEYPYQVTEKMTSQAIHRSMSGHLKKIVEVNQ